jgi:hypothetical protein
VPAVAPAAASARGSQLNSWYVGQTRQDPLSASHGRHRRRASLRPVINCREAEARLARPQPHHGPGRSSQLNSWYVGQGTARVD